LSLDARSLLIVGGFLCWILAAAIEFQAVRPSGSRVMPDAWTLGLLAKGMGLNLISQRGLIADAWSISLAHALLLAGLLFFYVALQRIRGAVTSRLMVAVMPVSVALVLPIVGFSQEAFTARVLVIMSAWLFGFSLSCWSAIQIARSGYLAGASMILGSNAILAALAIAFGLAVVAHEVAGVFAGGGVQLAFYAINDVCIALGTFGYMDIVRVARNQRQAADATQPDRLTGLYSGHAFVKLGVGELHRARRRDYPVCALALRIDNFDVVKALRGPVFADIALKRVAAVVLKEIRIYDVAGRVSADLIGVVMPELPMEAGWEVAERIRVKVASDPGTQSDAPSIAISIGLCEAQAAQQDLDAVMAVAAACLDRAQREGGNRVVTPASPPSKVGEPR
jgi:diguanylate cyclase (GGDEF)-like protein